MLFGHSLFQAYKKERRMTSKRKYQDGTERDKRKTGDREGGVSPLGPEVITNAHAAGRFSLPASALVGDPFYNQKSWLIIPSSSHEADQCIITANRPYGELFCSLKPTTISTPYYRGP